MSHECHIEHIEGLFNEQIRVYDKICKTWKSTNKWYANSTWVKVLQYLI